MSKYEPINAVVEVEFTISAELLEKIVEDFRVDLPALKMRNEWLEDWTAKDYIWDYIWDYLYRLCKNKAIPEYDDDIFSEILSQVEEDMEKIYQEYIDNKED